MSSSSRHDFPSHFHRNSTISAMNFVLFSSIVLMMAMIRSVSAFGPIAARPMIRNNARKSDVKMFVY